MAVRTQLKHSVNRKKQCRGFLYRDDQTFDRAEMQQMFVGCLCVSITRGRWKTKQQFKDPGWCQTAPNGTMGRSGEGCSGAPPINLGPVGKLPSQGIPQAPWACLWAPEMGKAKGKWCRSQLKGSWRINANQSGFMEKLSCQPLLHSQRRLHVQLIEVTE